LQILVCHRKYVKLLQDNSIKISMTENGDPLENAIAERVNGIIKEEYLQDYYIQLYMFYHLRQLSQILRQLNFYPALPR